MLFNSFDFLLFFPIVTAAYFLLPHGLRWGWLLGASCFFYMTFVPVYIFILLITIIIDYVAAIYIEKTQNSKRKKFLLISSIISTCLVLFIFKYFNFFNSNLTHLAQFLRWNYPVQNLSILLPIGLSFHTFQSLSYVIEVFRGNQKAERHFGIYALYVMFYPQLVAGPIERPQNLLHQFYQRHFFDYKRITDGLKLMLWGFLKKIVIADRLAIYVNQVYNNPSDYQGLSIILATYFFAFQIYCDFSGYSDIAIGSAKVMGFKLMDNFDRPYFAKSIAEFWRRWHISLSTWFKDYLYIPLGGSKVSKGQWYRNIAIVFLVSGLWHGANWTFIIWGLLHGFYIVFSDLTRKGRERIAAMLKINQQQTFYKAVKILTTFHLVAFSWIFFRASSVQDAFLLIRNMARINTSELGINILNEGKSYIIIALITIAVMEVIHFLQRQNNIRCLINQKPLWLRWGIYYAAVLCVLFLGEFKNQEFIYFQF